ncbi:MAG: ROK family protein [Clostridia bacterium]|nr:ROK family protein [Clostridia bacterium]
MKIPVTIRNDAKCAAIAEKTYGALKKYEDCVFLCLGTGIGASVFLQGKQLTAQKNSGFEIGHMIIEKDGKQCNCGKKGCFETYCSMKRFKEQLILALNLNEKVKAPQLITILEEQHDNSKVQEIIKSYLENLLVGVSNIIDIFEPQAICLGGSFVYFKDILYDPFLKQYEQRKYVYNQETLPKIVLSNFQNDAGIIGATIE